jgi:hypothetical protein
MKKAGHILTRRLAIAGACALAVAPPALAHRSQSVLTTMNWNAATSTLEVMHRIHAHDAEVGLAQSAGVDAIDITQVRNQALLMLYVEKHFSLAAPSGPITLSPVGAEFESEAILLYQEAKLKAPPAELSIDNRILRDVFDTQTNLVNVKLDKRTRTLIFAGRDGVKQAKDLL